MDRQEPLIPKLRSGTWDYHISKNEDMSANGSVFTEEREGIAYAIAKQPRYTRDEEWETHAKAMSAVPEMLKFLISEWYTLGEEIMAITKLLENGSMSNKYPYQNRRDKYRAKYDEITKILEKAGAFDNDRY